MIPRELKNNGENSVQLPEDLSKKLKNLNHRLLPRELEAVIRELCTQRPFGLREMAMLLNRSPVYLQNTVLKRLLKEGKIRFLYSDEPNHPRQAYKTWGTSINEPISTIFELDTGLDIGRND